jgi:hypothetical protein
VHGRQTVFAISEDKTSQIKSYIKFEKHQCQPFHQKECKAECDLPNLFEDMVSCDKCSTWYHFGCSSNGTLVNFQGRRLKCKSLQKTTTDAKRLVRGTKTQ